MYKCRFNYNTSNEWLISLCAFQIGFKIAPAITAHYAVRTLGMSYPQGFQFSISSGLCHRRRWARVHERTPIALANTESVTSHQRPSWSFLNLARPNLGRATFRPGLADKQTSDRPRGGLRFRRKGTNWYDPSVNRRKWQWKIKCIIGTRKRELFEINARSTTPRGFIIYKYDFYVSKSVAAFVFAMLLAKLANF